MRSMNPEIYIRRSLDYTRTFDAAEEAWMYRDLVDDQSRHFKARLDNQKIPKNRFIAHNNKVRRMAYKQPLINRNETTK